MLEWCHSGIEGYCKAAAEMLGKPSNKGDSLLPLCNDILRSRTRNTLTSTWTLSRNRRGTGTSNRLKLFEEDWLGEGSNASLFMDEALKAYQGNWNCAGLPTIENHPSYIQSLQQGVQALTKVHGNTAAHDSSLKKAIIGFLHRRAMEECENRAVRACVDHITALDEDGEYMNNPALSILVAERDFSINFYGSVMKAMESGFMSERYRPSDVRQYMNTLSNLLSDRLVENNDAFRSFVQSLVAGLIYGPDNSIALSRPFDATRSYQPYDHPYMIQTSVIRITQLFDSEMRTTGYSEVYNPSQIIFFGRCPSINEYLAKCEELLSGNVDLMSDIMSREAVIFPIACNHEQTSNIHAMLYHEGDAWRLYDFFSTNGTSIRSIEQASNDSTEVLTRKVTGLMEIVPGDMIRLGAPNDVDDAMVYRGATVVLLTSFVDELME